MKKNNIIAYTCVGASLAGAYILGRINGFNKGFSKACNECINVCKEVIIHNKKEDKVEEESK